jgi:hypothetical protein
MINYEKFLGDISVICYSRSILYPSAMLSPREWIMINYEKFPGDISVICYSRSILYPSAMLSPNSRGSAQMGQ